MKFLYGPETYLVHQRLKELKRNFGNNNPQAEVVEFDLEEDSLDDVLEVLLQGQGLFSTKKMIVIKNALGLSESKRDELQLFLKKKQIGKKSDLELIFAETNEKNKKELGGKLGKYLKRSAEKEEFKKKTDDQLRQWINGEFLKRSANKVTSSMMSTRELILISRGNLWQLSNEIDKLISFKESGVVEVEDVRELCFGRVDAKIFDLVDAIGLNNKKRALLLKQQLFEQGENEFYIFSMIVFQFRNLVKVSDCLRRGIRVPEMIKQKVGLHPFVIRKTIANLGKYPLSKIKKIYKMIAELDQRIKNSEIKTVRALEWLIVRI